MPYDLDSMMRHLGPGVAGQWAGQNEALSQQKQGLYNQTLEEQMRSAQQSREFEAAMQPHKLQEAGLRNEGLQADLPGRHAQSLTRGYEATLKGATLPSEISAGVAKNDSEVTEAKAKKARHLQDVFVNSISMVEATPAPMRSSYIRQLLIDNDAKEDEVDKFMQLVASVPAEQLPRMLASIGEGLGKYGAKSNPKLVNDANIAAARDASDERQAARSDASREAAAMARLSVTERIADKRMAAKTAGGKAVAQGYENELGATKTADQRISVHEKYAAIAAVEGNEELSRTYQARADREHQIRLQRAVAGAQERAGGQVDAAGYGVPVTPKADHSLPPREGAKPAVPQGKVMMINPQGQKGYVPAAQVEAALKRGFKRTE